MTNVRFACVVAVCGVLTWGAPAEAQSFWDNLFRSENRHVRDGNDALASGDAEGAVGDYDLAARELPSEPGVHLDRGLALLAQADHPRAREALQLATDPPAPREIRADANYDIGLSFYQEADAAATADDHETAQRDFREAADAFRASLRQRPGNRDAAWNLELALRRIQEEEEAQEQEEQEQQDQQDQEQDQQDQQDQQQDQQDQQQDQQQSDQQDQQDGQQADAQEPQPAEPDTTGTRDSLPPDERQVLDALEDGEQNFQGARARARGDRERRRVTQDW